MVADVTIRRQTHNRKGLQDALRATGANGSTIDQERSLIKDRFRDRYQIESSDALLAHGDEPNPQHAHDETYQGMRLRLTRSSEPSE